jgi:hypothetical protein
MLITDFWTCKIDSGIAHKTAEDRAYSSRFAAPHAQRSELKASVKKRC